ncbi:hypothetical protein ACJJH9_04505 [Microbulbifer sp. DLAB2-AF]|uniref:hypothetical protein n=1 Tax=Microbulbifer sp. DLAB2-AF TaxID=3243395 RepID=UPI00403923D6
MKYIVVLLLGLICQVTNACEIPQETTAHLIKNSKGIYVGYVTSLRVKSIENVTEDQFPPMEISGLYDRTIKVSLVETLLGAALEEKLVEIELGSCGSPNVQVGEKIVAFHMSSGLWQVKSVGVNPSDIRPRKP